MNFTSHFIVVIVLVVVFVLIAGFWAISAPTTKSNTATAIEAVFGVAKDSYTVLPGTQSTDGDERASFVSKIRAALRDLPEPVIEEEIIVDVPVPSTPLPTEVAPEVVPLPIVEPVLVPVETLEATTTSVIEAVPLPSL